jgi:flagellar M-ring protein FliF
MDASSAQVPAQTGGNSLMLRLRTAFSRFDTFSDQPALRRSLPALAVVSAVAVGVVAWMLLAPADRMTLQSGLPEAEKALALDALTAAGIDAQMDPATGILSVLSSDFHRARMVLATEGLPQGTPDAMSAISEMPMGTSRQVEAARLRRMQELELAQSIAELRPVRNARVHLALPERTAFVRDQQPARASVFVELAPGSSLSEAQVNAIVSLVSTAVPDMARNSVSVVDQAGNLLTTDESNPDQMINDRNMRHRIQMERLYRDRVLALLTPIVGAGNAAVEITLDMDFTRSEITSEQFLPQTALRSEQQSVQENSSAGAVGIPGAVSNTPPPEPELETADRGNPAEETRNSNRSSSSTRNYEVSRRVETRQPATAQIKRVNAAILLHHLPQPAAEDGAEGTAPVGPPLEEIEALTRSVIGFDADRGDVVTVTAAPFVAQQNVIPSAPWYSAPWVADVGRVLAQIAILAIIVLGVVKPLLTRLLPPVGGGEAALAGGYGDAIEVGRGESLQSLRQRLDTVAAPEDPNAAITYEEKVALLRQLVGEDKNRVAGVFKAMLTDPNEEKD